MPRKKKAKVSRRKVKKSRIHKRSRTKEKRNMFDARKVPRDWEIAEAILPHARRVLLYGPPGTGKTYAGLMAGAEGQPVFSVTLTDDTPAAELRGHYIPNSAGGFDWHHGTAVKAWLDDGILVLNEINKASSDVQSLCHVILDDMDSAKLTLPNGEMVTPGPNFRCVATMNGQPEDLPEALRDRFTVRIPIMHVHPAAIVKLPEYMRTIAKEASDLKDDRRLSIRAFYSFVTLSAKIDEATAGEAVFGPRWPDLRDAIALAKKAAADSTKPTMRVIEGPQKPADLIEQKVG